MNAEAFLKKYASTHLPNARPFPIIVIFNPMHASNLDNYLSFALGN